MFNYDENYLSHLETKLKMQNKALELLKIGLTEKVSYIAEKISETEDLDEKAKLTEELQELAEAVNFYKREMLNSARNYKEELEKSKGKVNV